MGKGGEKARLWTDWQRRRDFNFIRAKQIDNLVKDLSTLGECTLQTDRAIVSIIGEGMKHRVSLNAM